GTSTVTFTSAPAAGQALTASYQIMAVNISGESVGPGDGSKTTFNLAASPASTDQPFVVRVNSNASPTATLSNDDAVKKSRVNFLTAPAAGAVTVDYQTTRGTFTGEAVGTGDGAKTTFDLKNYPARGDAGSLTVKANGALVTGVTVTNDNTARKSRLSFS